MRRTEHSAAAVHSLCQHLARSRVVLDRDQDAAEVGHRPDGRGAVPAERLALRLQEGLEGRPGGGVVGQGALRQAQVVEGAQGRRILQAK